MLCCSSDAVNPAQKQAPKAGPTLYERLGGAPAVQAAVELFYKKVMADPLLVPFFEGVPMDKQQRKQVMFMTYAFGGAKDYSGKNLKAAHTKLIKEKGLNLTHFDAVAAHLVATLKELGVAENLVDEAAQVVLATRPVFDPANY